MNLTKIAGPIIKRIIFIAILAPSATGAIDLGVYGQTFKINEESFIFMMKKNLDLIDIEAHQAKMQTQAKYRVENPVGADHIVPAVKTRVFHFDPSYILPEDILLPCGKILPEAGKTVNPLEHMELNRRLFFIDSRQEDQIAWLKERLNSPLAKQEQKEQVEDRVILVGGSVFKLQELLGQDHADKVYFDQAAELTTKFGIKASPAIVEQEGLRLKIEEVKL